MLKMEETPGLLSHETGRGRSRSVKDHGHFSLQLQNKRFRTSQCVNPLQAPPPSHS